MTGGQIIAEWMEAFGLGAFFHVPGETFLSVLDALYDRPGIRVVTFRHESGAAFAAEAYGKLGGRPAVAMGTRGPGASNLSIGVQTARYDGTPMVVLLGQVPRESADSGAFQEIDMGQFYAPLAKRVIRVQTAEALPAALSQAVAVATEPRPGPVVVVLPTDLLSGPGPERPIFARLTAHPTSFDPAPVVRTLETAERPVLLVATEAVRGPAAADLARFASAAGLPVLTAWRRFSAYPNDDPQFVGSVGIGAPAGVVETLVEADLVLVLGWGLEHITVAGGARLGPTRRVVQMAPALDADGVRRVGGARVEWVAVEPREAARALREWAERHPEAAAAFRERFAPRTERLRARLEADTRAPADPAPGRVHMDFWAGALDRRLPDDAVVVSDAGNFAQWLLRYVRFGGRRAFLAPVNGAMGYALPGALGARVAAARPVWAVAGDGGFFMTLGELETAVRERLDVVAVVVNNARYGTIRANQEREYPGRVIGSELSEVDVAAVARTVGWRSWRVTADADLDDALEAAAAATGPRLVEVVVEREPLALSLRDFQRHDA
ncbi:MAG: thiamine pyrophosphate-binding protein [Actinomycetia bacterium]|nr:thiamine pyrophosphate-binding protein [Actinomycetes bacterium]